jgi:hypothetical protein
MDLLTDEYKFAEWNERSTSDDFEDGRRDGLPFRPAECGEFSRNLDPAERGREKKDGQNLDETGF